MTLKQLIYIVVIATLVCWFILGMVITQTDPTGDGLPGLVLFYLALFFSLVGTFFLVSFSFRKNFTKYSIDYKIVATSFRQSVFFAILVIGILFLQSSGLLTWWNIILLILALMIVEGFSLSMKRQI